MEIGNWKLIIYFNSLNAIKIPVLSIKRIIWSIIISMNSILSFLQQSLVLTKMQRTHKRHLGNSEDSIAEHTYHASIIAYCLCRMEGLSHEQGLKSMGMVLIHDIAEVRTADHGFIEKHYVEVNEDKANKDTFLKLDFGKDLYDLNAEFEAIHSPNS